MTTPEQLLDFVGGNQSDLEFCGKCLAQAQMLVNAYCIRTPEIPEEILDNAYLQVGSELFHRRNAPSGIAQFSSLDGTSPVRVAKDPMTSVYPLLNRWVVNGV
jgi:uncharacterized protein YuzB (UPF0349 family)